MAAPEAEKGDGIAGGIGEMIRQQRLWAMAQVADGLCEVEEEGGGRTRRIPPWRHPEQALDQSPSEPTECTGDSA